MNIGMYRINTEYVRVYRTGGRGMSEYEIDLKITAHVFVNANTLKEAESVAVAKCINECEKGPLHGVKVSIDYPLREFDDE